MINYFIYHKLRQYYLDAVWNGNHLLPRLNIKNKRGKAQLIFSEISTLQTIALPPFSSCPQIYWFIAIHSTNKAHLYCRAAETRAYKDNITCQGLQKSLWKQTAHFILLPVLSLPHDINKLEVDYSRHKYLKPYVQLISAHMTRQTEGLTSQVEAMTQINTTVSVLIETVIRNAHCKALAKLH